MYRFNDAQQGTDPIFVKVFLGRGTTGSYTRIRLQIGQGSNGSGTLTGTVSTVMTVGDTYATYASDFVYSNYAFAENGVVWFAYGVAPTNIPLYPPRHWCCISRTRNQSTQAFDGVGAIYLGCTGDPSTLTEMCYTRWATGVNHSLTWSRNYVLVVGAVQYADDGTTKLAWPHFFNDNGTVKYCWAHWTTAASFLTLGVNTFTADPYGTGSRTWWACGDNTGPALRGVGTATISWALILPWE
jgi:hypothetical protein